MGTVVTGRRIGADGRPVEGTGFAYESDGPLAALLAQRVSPLISQPVTGEFVIGLATSEQTGGAYERGVGIFPSGNAGPPEHFHPLYEESFEIVQGEFIFRIAGKESRVGPGAQFAVPKQTPHTFRCVSEGYGVALVETRPAARIGLVLFTLFGMAHEDLLTTSGQPKLLQAMLIASEYADDTVFVSPPPSVALPMAKALAPLGRMLGYVATNPKYLDEAFWRAHVEQP